MMGFVSVNSIFMAKRNNIYSLCHIKTPLISEWVRMASAKCSRQRIKRRGIKGTPAWYHLTWGKEATERRPSVPCQTFESTVPVRL